MVVDDFKGSEGCLEKFQKMLFPKNENNIEGQNQLCHIILLALKFKINGSKNTCASDELEKIVGKDLFKEINQPEKFKFIIDQQYFFNMCYHITMILAKFGYFLRVHELKKKYRYLFMKKTRSTKNGKTIIQLPH